MSFKFPFKSLTLYRVQKSFKSPRGGDNFEEGLEISYEDSTTNSYDGIEICRFRERISGKELIWHADQEIDLGDHWRTLLEPIPWPKA